MDIGTVMNRSSSTDFDTWIAATAENNDWFNVFMIKSYAMHAGYSSSTIDDSVKLALTNMPMFEEYPIPISQVDSYGQWFWPFYKFTLYGYRYAQELNWETERWDPNAAFSYLALVYDTFGTSFYRMNGTLEAGVPVSAIFAEGLSYGSRWLEFGKLIGCFMIFHDLGIDNALLYALKCWEQMNDELWRTDHFTYSTGWFGYEFSSMDALMDPFKLKMRMAYQQNSVLQNSDRLVTDMQSRYLSGYGNGQWSIQQGDTTITQHLKWSNDGGVSLYNETNNVELRLDGTLNAWILNHLAFAQLPAGSQSMVTAMLEGDGMVKASDGLLQSSLVENMSFMLTSLSGETTDAATAMGALCLFLNGISVREGAGLAIPMITDNENDHSAINSYHFGFDHENQQIKIPVWGGTTMNFMFGSNQVQMTFWSTGVFLVSFSYDWNSITDCEVVSGLKTDESYLPP